jgi:hypothetical protein
MFRAHRRHDRCPRTLLVSLLRLVDDERIDVLATEAVD